MGTEFMLWFFRCTQTTALAMVRAGTSVFHFSHTLASSGLVASDVIPWLVLFTPPRDANTQVHRNELDSIGLLRPESLLACSSDEMQTLCPIVALLHEIFRLRPQSRSEPNQFQAYGTYCLVQRQYLLLVAS